MLKPRPVNVTVEPAAPGTIAVAAVELEPVTTGATELAAPIPRPPPKRNVAPLPGGIPAGGPTAGGFVTVMSHSVGPVAVPPVTVTVSEVGLTKVEAPNVIEPDPQLPVTTAPNSKPEPVRVSTGVPPVVAIAEGEISLRVITKT